MAESIAYSDTPNARRRHGKEGILAFRLLGHTVLRAFPDGMACIVGGYARDMLLQDYWARQYYAAQNSSGTRFGCDVSHPVSYKGRTMAPKDIDVVTFCNETIEHLHQRIGDRLATIPSVKPVECAPPVKIHGAYISLPPYVESIFTMRCKYYYGGLAGYNTIHFKIDVIYLSCGAAVPMFQTNAPFSSDRIAAWPVKLEPGSYVPHDIARLPITRLFAFVNEDGDELSDCPDDIVTFTTHLKSEAVLNATHALNVLTRIVQKTRLGWKVHGIAFKIFVADEDVHVATNRGRVTASMIVNSFHMNRDRIELAAGTLKSADIEVTMFNPATGKLLVGGTECGGIENGMGGTAPSL